METDHMMLEVQFCQLILRICDRYGMYIGQKSITRLFHFLNGYKQRVYEETQYLPRLSDDFFRFVQQQMPGPYWMNWDGLLLQGHSEEEAFDLFVTLFEAFLQEKMQAPLLRAVEKQLE